MRLKNLNRKKMNKIIVALTLLALTGCTFAEEHYEVHYHQDCEQPLPPPFKQGI